MASKVRLAVSKAAYLRPLLYGLDAPDSPFELIADIPAVNSIHFNERTGNLRCAFLSPIDYARYGGLYRIIPQICVSSSNPTGTITLTIKRGVRNVQKVAVDIRVTSEIILAKIILLERFRNLPEDRGELEFLPMMPDPVAMLQKADAALIINFESFRKPAPSDFILDLVEEWTDMTGYPYVHGFWVTREADLPGDEVKALIEAKINGTGAVDQVAASVATEFAVPQDECAEYFESFSYDFGVNQIESLSEFIRYAYFHGVIGDVPELQFLEASDDV